MEGIKLKDVLLVTSDEKALSYKWDEKSNNLSGVQVISNDYDLKDLQNEVTFIGLQGDKEQVFVKDPFYIDTYVEVTKAEERIFKNKIKNYKRIAFLLGAKAFSAKAEFIEENKFTTEIDGSIKIKVVKIDGEYKEEQTQKFNSTYDLKSEFEPDINFDRQRAFEEALQLVKELNLENEIDIVGLIENNNPAYQNREKKQNLKLQLSHELNDLLETSFSINAMAGTFNLGGSFKSTTESINKIILQTEIIF
jgi:hypothetical protein